MATQEELEHLRLGLIELQDALKRASEESRALIPTVDASWAPYHNGMANAFEVAAVNVEQLLNGKVPGLLSP